MDLLFFFGRLLFGGYFLLNGLNHFTKSGALIAYAEAKKVPQARVAVYLSGLLLIFGGGGVVLGVMTKLSLSALALFLIVVSFKMHNYWSSNEDPSQRAADMVNFTKNMALLGAVLMLFITTESSWLYSFIL